MKFYLYDIDMMTWVNLRQVAGSSSGSSSESSSESDSDADSSSDSDSGAKVRSTKKVASDSESSSDSSDSESDTKLKSSKKAGDDSDSESNSDSSDSDSDHAEPDSKKRKATAEAETTPKKAKTGPSTEEGIKNLFIGGLSWNVDEDWLRSEFEQFGEIVAVRIVTDRESGRSKGYVLSNSFPRGRGKVLEQTWGANVYAWNKKKSSYFPSLASRDLNEGNFALAILT